MKKNLLILALAAISVGIASCAPKSETGTGTATAGGGEILIGEYGSLTGGVEDDGGREDKMIRVEFSCFAHREFEGAGAEEDVAVGEEDPG